MWSLPSMDRVCLIQVLAMINNIIIRENLFHQNRIIALLCLEALTDWFGSMLMNLRAHFHFGKVKSFHSSQSPLLRGSSDCQL